MAREAHGLPYNIQIHFQLNYQNYGTFHTCRGFTIARKEFLTIYWTFQTTMKISQHVHLQTNALRSKSVE